MAIDFSKIAYFQNLTAEDIPETPLAWLQSLESPSIIDFVNNENHPWRVITTLLQGNSPSGFYAVHQLIKAGAFKKLKINVRVIVASVEAARHEPAFSHVALPEGKNLDRCFGTTSLSQYFLRAQMLAASIRQVKPIAVLDLQNTQGSSPAYAMSLRQSHDHLALASLFCKTLVVSDLRLGAIFEQNFDCPVVSVQCGNPELAQNNHLTETALIDFIEQKDLSLRELPSDLAVIHDAKLIKLSANKSVAYGTEPSDADITLKDMLKQCNFTKLAGKTHIGWTAKPASELLESESRNEQALEEFLAIENGHIYCQPGTFLFSINPLLPQHASDRLFFVAKEELKLNKK
ncbi:hypothetical protein [Thalassotalea euphylliae]|uniref:Succinylglutamate desuccinylase n=1 Tax=Thalassotalea euphylliae TaxID=1655234 RepID=A0A3E0TXU4_9GAMM|nr:hypothetical protein [Thalassotalea euphylliae]REL29270.1 hypothetical protein DXX94_00160 [Thalassotalea euphylliae]